MMRSYLLSDKKSLLRQAIVAWAIVTVGTVMFTLIALWITPIIGSEELSIILAFSIILPILVAAHIWLYKRRYHFWKVKNNDLVVRYEDIYQEHLQLLQTLLEQFRGGGKKRASFYRMLLALEEGREYLLITQVLRQVLQERSEAIEVRQAAARALAELAGLERSNIVLQVLRKLEQFQETGEKRVSFHWMLRAPEEEREYRLIIQTLRQVLQERSESFIIQQEVKKVLYSLSNISEAAELASLLTGEKKSSTERQIIAEVLDKLSAGLDNEQRA